MNEPSIEQYEQPLGSLLIVIDQRTGSAGIHFQGPYHPALMNNALDLAKAQLVGQQIQAMAARREPGIEVASGVTVPRNPRA